MFISSRGTMRRLGWMCLVGVVFCCALPATAQTESYKFKTLPSEDLTLAFVQPGIVQQVGVKDGDAVKKGDLLLQLDDRAERQRLTLLQAQAEDTIQVDAAEAQWKQNQTDLKKTEWAYQRGVATDMELEHARLEAQIGLLSVKLAKFKKAQAQREYDEARIQIERMRMTSPISGKVEAVICNVGEGVDAQEDIVRVVQIDPLHVEGWVPMAHARGILAGHKAEVAFQDGSTATGEVVFVPSVADPVSGELKLRVELPNPKGRPAGESVRITFPASTASKK